MNETIHLKNTNIPKMVGSLIHKIELLKFFAAAAMLISILVTITLTQVVSKPPIVIPLGDEGELLREGQMPKPESEIKKAIIAYLDFRYKWEPKNVESQLKN